MTHFQRMGSQAPVVRQPTSHVYLHSSNKHTGSGHNDGKSLIMHQGDFCSRYSQRSLTTSRNKTRWWERRSKIAIRSQTQKLKTRFERFLSSKLSCITNLLSFLMHLLLHFENNYFKYELNPKQEAELETYLVFNSMS